MTEKQTPPFKDVARTISWRPWRPRYPGTDSEERSKVEPPAIQIIRSPDRDWTESALRGYAARLRNTAQHRVLTEQQRRNCLQNAERAEHYADEKQANALAE